MSIKHLFGVFQSKELPIPIKKGTQILDGDSNVGYEFDGSMWVRIPYYCELTNVTKPLQTVAERDAIRRAGERDQVQRCTAYSTPRILKDDSFNRSLMNDYVAASMLTSSSNLSDTSNSGSHSHDSSSSSSYSSSDSSSSYDSSSSSCE
jgi:hypothetical protein